MSIRFFPQELQRQMAVARRQLQAARADSDDFAADAMSCRLEELHQIATRNGIAT